MYTAKNDMHKEWIHRVSRTCCVYRLGSVLMCTNQAAFSTRTGCSPECDLTYTFTRV